MPILDDRVWYVVMHAGRWIDESPVAIHDHVREQQKEY